MTKRKAGQRMTSMPGPGGGPAGAGSVGEQAKNVKGTIRRVTGYFSDCKAALAWAVLMSAVSTGMAIAAPYFMGRAIDQLMARSLPALIHLTLLMAGAYLLSAGAQLVQGFVVVRITQKAVRAMRAELFRHLQTLSLKFFDARSQGELMSRLTNDMDAVSNVLTSSASQLFTGVLTLAGILGIMFYLSPLLALGSMVAFPLMIGLVGMVGKKTRHMFRTYQARLGELNATLEEIYSGQRVVMSFGQETAALSRFDNANEGVRRIGVKAMTLALIIMPMMGILSNLNVAILCGLGGWMAIEGMVTVGTIAAFISYSRRFSEPLRQLGNLYNQVQGALAGAERIFEILDTLPDQTDAPGALTLSRVTGGVRLEGVSFSYRPGTPVLTGIHFHAAPGQRIAIVGKTGAGKTTLVNLLSRFYDIDEGVIRIDGIDITTVTRDSLRRQIGAVLQHSFLFTESVMDNIRYGRQDASDDEVVEAARLACAHGFIRRLPEGYDTILAERGENLSEGQRQLLCIARAILADPAILILDEATSSVDTRTESEIQQALDRLMQGRTSFVIAHRLSTIIHADRVLVMDEGQIVEQGTHDELLAKGGIYHRLYTNQFRGLQETLRLC